MELGSKKISVDGITIPVFYGMILFVTSLLVLLSKESQPNISFSEFSPLSYASLGLFILMSAIGLIAENLYFTFLVFVILAFPAPVNDFFPGTYLGDPLEFGTAIFPFITHIDIYLLLGLIKALILNNKVHFKGSRLFLLVITSVFVSIIYNFFHYKSNHELLLLIDGMFQFRYLVALFLLLAVYDFNKYRNNILIGFGISLLFLLLESFFYSKKIHSDVLVSGSLANNVFASIVASILLFILFVRKRFKHSFIFNVNLTITAMVASVIIIGTKARMAILAFLVTYFMVLFLERKSNRSIIKLISLAVGLLFFLGIIVYSAPYLPKRYNYHTVVDKIHFGEFSSDLTKFIIIERSWETSSLITRLKLYNTSMQMFRAHPVCGIGVGRWNIQKNAYGFDEHLLIDSHNGYLSLLSQYGLLGLPLLYFIYLYPIVKIFRNSKANKAYGLLFFLSIINLYVAFSDLSNSGIFKHQIFCLLAFNSICLLQTKNMLMSITPDNSKNILNSHNEDSNTRNQGHSQ